MTKQNKMFLKDFMKKKLLFPFETRCFKLFTSERLNGLIFLKEATFSFQNFISVFQFSMTCFLNSIPNRKQLVKLRLTTVNWNREQKRKKKKD